MGSSTDRGSAAGAELSTTTSPLVDRIELSNDAILSLLALPSECGTGDFDDLAYLQPPSGPPASLGPDPSDRLAPQGHELIAPPGDDHGGERAGSAAESSGRRSSRPGQTARYVCGAAVVGFACAVGVLSVWRISYQFDERPQITPRGTNVAAPRPDGATSAPEPVEKASSGAGVIEPSSPSPSTVTVDGDRLPPLSSSSSADERTGRDDPTLGAAFPTITGRSLGGGQVTLSPGSPMLVAVVAHWSADSQSLVKQLTEIAQVGAVPPGVVVAAISSADRPGGNNYPPEVWFSGVGFPFSVLIDDARRSTVVALSVDRFPTMIAVRPDGSISAVHRGAATQEDIISLLRLTIG